MLRSVLAVLLFATTAWAHALLTAPVPRNDFDDVISTNALHPPPCGGPRGTVVLSKQVGDQLLVTWDETIDHPGHYELMFAQASDSNFVYLTDLNGAMLNNITDVQGGTLPHHYTQMVKLPSGACPACTLQMKQYNSDTANYYLSCADVQLTAIPGSPSPSPSPIVTDGGMAPAPDLANAPMPSSDPAATPSMPPADDPSTTPDAPDMAAPAKIGPTQYDYSYGCSAVPGAAGSLPLLLLISALGIARIARRPRSRSRV